MTFTPLALFAQAEQPTARTVFEWGRAEENADLILPIAVCLALMVFVRAMYRRDAVELPRALGWLLTAMRTAALLGLLILYLQPQWRTEREEVRNSRVMLLVDTSLSMGLTDAEPADRAKSLPESPSPPAPLPASEERGERFAIGSKPISRVEQVAAALAEGDFLGRLRRTHDVFVLRFGEALDRDRAVVEKEGSGFGGSGIGDRESGPESSAPSSDHVDWAKFLAPVGMETRLGAALRQVLDDESGLPLSGIVVFSDGGQNAGIAPEVPVHMARRANVPIFTVGVGSDQQPTNVRVSDLVAPARAYPGDSYTVTGFVQSQRSANVTPGAVEGAGVVVDVELLSREGQGESAGAEPPPWQVEARQQVTLGARGEVLPVRFELTPQETGRRTLRFRVEAPEGDHDPADDHREVDIEIVDRRTHVLMLAGGPTREYRFLRNQLYRDRSTSVDVLLQSARGGISQEADKLLDEFPTTRQQMFDYDCLLAFDPDWRALTATQVDLLEQWVAEQGGGLIVIAGPVYTGTMIGGWVEDPAMAKIRALYPVEFHRRFSVLEERAYVAKEQWPLEFTREGLEAEYLWLDDAATASRVPTGRGIVDVAAMGWAGFDGVYSFAPVRGPKPAATVLARFSDPRAAQAGEQPVFFAAQFYGSGRVFYIGSGEMWRLRRLDETYFEGLYTKLVRHVSQGRLLRGSGRGVLLLGQDRYLLGNSVEARAQLTNARLEPLVAEDVSLQVVGPQGSVQTVTLRPEAGRAGTFAGRFSVLEEGSYRLELPVPESADERLTRRIQVMMPQLERENPQRNDKLLRRIANGTGGKSYVGLGAALGTGDDSLVGQLKDCTRIEIRADEPDPDWERTWRMWMMCALCCLLCGEWLIRRLAKLA